MDEWYKKFHFDGFVLNPEDVKLPRLAGSWFHPEPLMFLGVFVGLLAQQLAYDKERWGDEWLKRPRKGQEARIINRIYDYYEEWMSEGKKIPWLKIAGLALIGWIREQYPEVWYELR